MNKLSIEDLELNAWLAFAEITEDAAALAEVRRWPR